MTRPNAANPAIHATMVRTLSGAYVDLLDPDPTTIVLEDVAHALASIRRWNGHARRPMSVAEHQLLALSICRPRVRLPVILHDAHEGLIGDLIRPVMEALTILTKSAVREAMETVKYGLDVAVVLALYADLGLKLDDPDLEARHLADEMRSSLCKAADDAMAAIERKALWRGEPANTASRALADQLIPAVEPADLAGKWLAAVRTEATAVYGGAA